MGDCVWDMARKKDIPKRIKHVWICFSSIFFLLFLKPSLSITTVGRSSDEKMSDEKKQTNLTEKQKISRSRAEKTRRVNKSRVGKDISLRQPASRIKWVANRVVLQTKEIHDALKSDDGEVAKLR